MKILFDIEADNLLQDVTQTWCIICKVMENAVKPYKDGDIVIFVPREWYNSFDISKLALKPSESVVCLPSEEFKDVFYPLVTSWVGHNAINYDSRVLRKLFGISIPVKQIEDTLILSQITQPNRLGGHSLKAWGVRFDDYKGEWKDFSKFDWNMVDYCLQDVRVTEKLYQHMQKNVESFSKFSVRLEHAVRGILDEMEENGFYLDQERAHNIYVEIKDHCDKLEKQIQKDFPPEKVYIKKLQPRLTAKGEMHGQDARTIANNLYDLVEETREDGKVVTNYHLYYWQSFNPRSTDQIVGRMDALGWEPVVRNEATEAAIYKAALEFMSISADSIKSEESLVKFKDKAFAVKMAEKKGFDPSEILGSPKVCEENFETLPSTAPQSAHTLAEWFLFDKRLQKLDEWFRELNPKTGCVHGRVFGCGAHTHRMTHRNPNMANISSVVSKKNEAGEEVLVWGKEGRYSTDMRACWTVRKKGRKLVGVDLSGIQLRALAHYANNKEYADQIISGDIHSYNRDILDVIIGTFVKNQGLDVNSVEYLKANPKGRRGFSKTFVYAYLFGAGNKKVGNIFGFPEHMQMDAGRFIKEEFAASIKGLDTFKKNIQKWARQGWMVGLDGRLISIPSAHIGLSIALQSFEAIVMKYSVVLADKKIKQRNLDAKLVIVCHDETQYDCASEHADEVGQLVVESMEEAGRFFKANLPLSGEAKTKATNWAESH